MAGGRGRINEYNQSLTPEQRKNNAKRAASRKRPRAKINTNIRSIARTINSAPAGSDLLTALAMLNIRDANVSNAAGIALSVYQAAVNGDMKAVEKWEKYVGQASESDAGGGVQIIDDL